ncbi:hypothetical protein GIB67_034524 [Kingdonia uniflora]|uniref:Uncharacterized protein n=1 Tax=Kingdonia uniflora TaxID=39325 RepID=A0A7J7PBK6_9MAGN|nr:hypothetical protein GIB67_034524 [Kingdonia uniflora]
MKEEIELKHAVDEQFALEFADLPRQLDAKILEYKNLEEKNTSLEGELRQKFGPEDCNKSLFVELNKKLVVLQSHQPVPDTTLANKYEDLLVAHEDIKKKLIAKEDFIALFNAWFEVIVVEFDDYQLHIVEFDNIGGLTSSIKEDTRK